MTPFDRILDIAFGLFEFGTFCMCCYTIHYWWSITPP